MSGTIVINKNNSFDVRTVDFHQIVNTLRSLTGQSESVNKLFATVDDFGMNMVCADELNPVEFANFANLMRKVSIVLEGTDEGLANFLRSVCTCIEADERLSVGDQ